MLDSTTNRRGTRRSAWVTLAVLIVAVIAGSVATAPPVSTQGRGRGQAPTQTAQPDATAPAAPRRDISGTWTPAKFGDGIQYLGARDFPDDGKRQLPYTPLALEKIKTYKPANGTRHVPPGEINDPAVIYCDPQGMPRQNLYELRTTQILQTPLSVVVLYQFDKIWRVIWADGRTVPTNPEPRWFGHSVGRWVDDYTFVAETVGTDERTWLDKTGRPHSADLRMEERFRRVNRDLLEFSVIIDDPKMYTTSWTAIDRLPMKLLPADTDVDDFMCSVSEYMQFNRAMKFGNPTATSTGGIVYDPPSP